MELIYDVAFVPRYGDSLDGDMWEDFMRHQRATLNAYAEKGWKLVSAVPVIHSVIEGATFGGVLLYFAPDDAGT